ncbi:hypothetical protein HPB47_002173 [Ixodes persulcatus]|uniref:Uncharacterized protein n=1 Tax=Ixodes persulcatus TaxID=34615 RepID=A0AC60PMU7_IXOPE|nr:hypothetical protein HPB47_002173 [Ixodes persulcatus]
MIHVGNEGEGNLRSVGEYMNAVMLKIRANQELQTLIEPSALLPLPEGDCQLQSGNVHDLCHLSHNRRLHLQRSHEEDPGSPLNVVATVLAKGVCFDAVYEYAALPLYLTGSLEGRLEMARMDLVIAAPANQGEQPTVKVFETKEFTGVNVSKLSAGLAFQKYIATTAIQAVKITIADVMTNKVLSDNMGSEEQVARLLDNVWC